MHLDDHDLLREYAVAGSESAFAELVGRYLDLVYSAALRQVRSPHLAEEIAQSVFLDLSRNAFRIKPGTPLIAWLSTVTRRTAIDVIRQESRRQSREQAALEIATMESTPPIWSQVEPLLDEAMAALKETDRMALLWRYFENKSLREVGLRLGTSDDAAQKRVNRAIDQLRTVFLKRGITISASGLAADLSAYAVQAAPGSLIATISTAAGTWGKVALLQSASLEVGRTLAMTTFQKTFLVIVAATTVGVGFYQIREGLHLRDALRRTEHTSQDRLNELAQLNRERALATGRLKVAESEVDSMLAEATRKAGDADLEAEMRAWLARVERLEQLRVERPELSIPELQLLDQDAWFTQAKDAQLDTEEQIRTAFGRLRNRAESIFVDRVKSALSGYMEGNAGKLPNDVLHLVPFFDPPVDPAMLTRYELLQTGPHEGGETGGMQMVIGTKFPVDVERDACWRIAQNGTMSIGSFLGYNIRDARKAFAQANDGRQPTDADQLTPFLKWPVTPDTLKKHFGGGRKR